MRRETESAEREEALREMEDEVALADEGCASEEEVVVKDVEVEFASLEALELPPMMEGGDREALVAETLSDVSLTAWRKLADGQLKG